MPLYEYQCTQCGHRTEVLQRLNDPPLAACPNCGGAVKKLISSPSFQFKGSGWYATDYAKKSGTAGKGEPSSGSSSADSGSSGSGGSAGSSDGEKKSGDSAGSGSSSSAADSKPAARSETASSSK